MSSGSQASGHRQLRPERPAWILWLGMLVVTGLVCLGIAEVTLRLLLPSTTLAMMRGGAPYVAYAGYTTYVPQTHWQGGNEAGQQFDVSYDEMGLRNPPQSLARADVLVLGDSFIAADNTPAEHTLVGELRAASIASYNAGVDGVGTFNEVHLLRDHLRAWHGRIVVVAFYLGNDFRDNYGDELVPEPSAAAIRPVRGRVGEGLRAVCKSLLTCNWLYHQVYLGLIAGEARDPMKSYALAQMEMLAKGRSAASDIAVAHTRQAFTELARIAALRGFTVVVLGVPSEAQVLQRLHEVEGFEIDARADDYGEALIRDRGLDFDRPDRLAAALASEAGFSYASLLSTFRAHEDEQLFYQINPHWTAAGQKLAAEILMPHLQVLLKTSSSVTH